MNRNVPFSIGCAVIFIAAFFALEILSTQATLTPQNAAGAPVAVSVPQETAIIGQVAAQPVAPSAPVTPPAVAPGLLPTVTLLPPKPASAAAVKKKNIAPPKPAGAATAPITITAQSLLDATTLSFAEQPSGPYEITLTTNTGARTTFVWGLDDATIGGSGKIPSFATAFSCNPPPTQLFFDVRTSYTCTITLTPLSGSDKRSQSKSFSFATGAGELIVTPPVAMGAVLENSENNGGFVFNNEDAEPVTITGLTLDVSYTALNTAAGPLVLRLLDPTTNLSIGDYHLENLPADAALPYTHTGTITAPLSFAVKATSQKMLPLVILGAQTMNISSVDPSMTITLSAITADPDNGKIMLKAAKIGWSCVVPVGAYDPNATSGPFATGEACR